jgi:EmrB/QacA subfamily drug resistance transporter
MDDLAAVTIAPPTKRPDPRRGHLVALIVACAFFMQNLDGTVIATALPTMARAFGAEPTRMNVALTSYLLSLAVFIPSSGWVADRFGARGVFRAAIVIFTLASVLCGTANSLTYLVLARILQGLGGAMMVPVGRLLLLRSVAKADLVSAMAWVSTPALIGPVLGPPVGGFIVTYFSWRWIFGINIPIGILGIVLVTLFVEDIREEVVAKFDWVGLVLSGVALSTLMFGLETVGRGVVAPVASWTALAVSLMTAALYIRHARVHAAPLIDLSLLRIPSFMVTATAGTLYRAGVGALPFLLPMMLQLDFGRSPEQSGLITFASAVGALVMKPAATAALRRFGFRNTLVINAVVSSILLGLIAAFRPWWPLTIIYIVLLAGGFFRSLQFTAYNALAFADIPRSRMSAASSFYSAIQQFSITLGVSMAAASLSVTMALAGHAAPLLSDFTVAFLVVGFISLCAAPLSLLMPRQTGADMSGHRHAA